MTWLRQPYGVQPDGPRWIAAAVTHRGAELAQLSPLQPGALHVVAFAPVRVPSLMVVGAPLLPPIAIGGVTVFVDAQRPMLVALQAAGASRFALPLPANAALIGTEVAEQRFDLDASAITATAPLYALVVP